MKKLAHILVSTILLQFNCFSLDLELIAKIKIPDNSKNVLDKGPYMNIDYIRNDGVFLAKTGGNGMGDVIIVNPNGKSFSFKSTDFNEINITNYVSQYTRNNEIHLLIDVIQERTLSENDGVLAAKTIGKNGFLTQERSSKVNTTVRQDVSTTRTDSTVTSQSNTQFTLITRYNANGIKLLSKTFTNITFSITSNNTSPSFNNPNSKLALHYEIKDGFILFYKLIDSDIFDIISANRVVFGSSQNGSITATVDNPEGSILNIQSSTNLVEWNTFKTIQNEPSLEIIFPASKPSEFIRAIE